MHFWSVLHVILWFSLIDKRSINATDYCATVHANHFLCDDRKVTKSKCPSDTQVYPRNDQEKKQVLKIVNKIRSDAAAGIALGDKNTLPTAGNMMQLIWNNELAVAADIVARRCDKDPRFSFCCKCNILDEYEVNILLHKFENMTERNPTWDVYFEHFVQNSKLTFRKSEVERIQSYFMEEPFIILAKAEVYHMGCAVAIHGVIHDFVCVFGPITEWRGKPMYLIGPPASKCPQNSQPSSQFPHLCLCLGKCYTPRNPSDNLANDGGNPSLIKYSRKPNEPPTDYCKVNPRHMACSKIATNPCHIDTRGKLFPISHKPTAIDRKDALAALNELRDRVAAGRMKLGNPESTLPPASDMFHLEWSDELEDAAKNMVLSCKILYFEFCCECLKFEKYDVNLLQLDILPDQGGCRLFYPCWKHYMDIVTNVYENKKIDHFRNYSKDFFSHDRFPLLARSELSVVGCAMGSYKKSEDGLFQHHAVCIFGGISGWKGTSMYKEGKSCTQCPVNSECDENSKYPNLCNCRDVCYRRGTQNSFTWFSEAHTLPPLKAIDFNNQETATVPLLDSPDQDYDFSNPQNVPGGDQNLFGGQKGDGNSKQDGGSQQQSSTNDATFICLFFNTFCAGVAIFTVFLYVVKST